MARVCGDLWCEASFYPDENLMKIINDEPNESWDDPDIPRDKWFLDLGIFNGRTTIGDWRWLTQLPQLIKRRMAMIKENPSMSSFFFLFFFLKMFKENNNKNPTTMTNNVFPPPNMLQWGSSRQNNAQAQFLRRLFSPFVLKSIQSIARKQCPRSMVAPQRNY